LQQAGATVTTDIVCFQRKAQPNNHHLDLTQIQLASGYRDVLSDYYIAHPEHILGNLEKYEFLLRKENRMRRGLKVVGSMAEVDKRLPTLIDQLQAFYSSPQRVNSNVVSITANDITANDQLIKIACNLEAVIAELNALIQQQQAA